MTFDELISEVEQCWGNQPFPDGDALTIHPLGLDEEFYDGLVGKVWHSLADEFLYYHADCIGILTPAGFNYFLPAFLIADLRKVGETQIGFWLLAALGGYNGGRSNIKGISGPEWFESRIDELNPRQRQCLAEYVRLTATGDEERSVVERIQGNV